MNGPPTSSLLGRRGAGARDAPRNAREGERRARRPLRVRLAARGSGGQIHARRREGRVALRARDVLELTVPHYAAFALGSPVAAYLVVTGAPPPPRFVLVVLSLLLAYLGFNVLNMLGDAALDAEAKPTRALPSGRTSRGEAAALAIALLGG